MMDVNRLPVVGHGSLLEWFERITDPRKRRGVRYSMVSILAMAACAVVSGMKSFDGIAQWAASLPQEALLNLGCTRPTPPSEITFRRVLQSMDADAFDRQVGTWLAQQQILQDKQIAVDGKTVRGSHDGDKKAIHLLSALVPSTGVTVAQRRVEEKTNEIPEIKPLLEPLALEGSVVTADALHTQALTAKYIVEEKKADYLLTVKDNQPRIKAEIESLGLRLMRSFSPSSDHSG